jgi:hypothetical protein
MSEIELTSLEPGWYGVQVKEGDETTSHRVHVPDDLEAAGIPVIDADPEDLVRESFAFLLEREPASSILTEFELPVIARYFPDYPEEIARRLS